MNPATPAHFEPAQRLQSLDALRGFDMIWIVGGEAIGAAVGHVKGGPGWGLFAAQFDHVDWIGFHFYDLIFPLFVFMVGVSITFSLGRLVASGGRAQALRRVVRRGLLLYVLGILYYGGL